MGLAAGRASTRRKSVFTESNCPKANSAMTKIDELPRETVAPAHILVAEDDRELRVLIVAALRAAGFIVTEAENGRDLLDRLADTLQPDRRVEAFDMVLSDIRLPGFTALDVMVGARCLLSTTRIVLMTAFGDAHTHEKALSLGATAVLDKPLRLDDLCKTVSRILNQTPAAGS